MSLVGTGIFAGILGNFYLEKRRLDKVRILLPTSPGCYLICSCLPTPNSCGPQPAPLYRKGKGDDREKEQPRCGPATDFGGMHVPGSSRMTTSNTRSIRQHRGSIRFNFPLQVEEVERRSTEILEVIAGASASPDFVNKASSPEPPPHSLHRPPMAAPCSRF